MNFNKDTRIGEILEKAPEKAEILLEIGMHCLGCPASQMETLEEACVGRAAAESLGKMCFHMIIPPMFLYIIHYYNRRARFWQEDYKSSMPEACARFASSASGSFSADLFSFL